MPTKFTIPAVSETHCRPCKYHVCIGSLHVYVGGGGWNEHACTHPDAYEPLPEGTDPETAKIIGEMQAREVGRNIGKTELQPDWCPLRREPAAASEPV